MKTYNVNFNLAVNYRGKNWIHWSGTMKTGPQKKHSAQNTGKLNHNHLCDRPQLEEHK